MWGGTSRLYIWGANWESWHHLHPPMIPNTCLRFGLPLCNHHITSIPPDLNQRFSVDSSALLCRPAFSDLSHLRIAFGGLCGSSQNMSSAVDALRSPECSTATILSDDSSQNGASINIMQHPSWWPKYPARCLIRHWVWKLDADPYSFWKDQFQLVLHEYIWIKLRKHISAV